MAPGWQCAPAPSSAISIRTPEGRALVRAVVLSMPHTTRTQDERAQHFRRRMHSIEQIRRRALSRGEDPPPLEQILDQLVAPFYLRAIFGIDPPATGYPEHLVHRLLGDERHTPATTHHHPGDSD